MSLVPAGEHGGDGALLAAALGIDPATVVDLSLSLNPLAPDVGPLVARQLDAIVRYPDDRTATAVLADAIGVDRERVLLTNGGAEAIALVAQHMPRGWADTADFSLYRRHLTTHDPDGPRWLSDPANPTGELRTADIAVAAAVRDEAFFPLATGRWTRDAGAGGVVVGSLTKLFACPGLRLGYVLADPELIAAVAELRPQWSVNGLAVSVLPDLLAAADLAGWARDIAVLRAELVALLGSFGYGTVPSDANYVWVPSAGGLRDRLAPLGVLVRGGTSFGFPDAVRIAVPPAAHLDRLATALERTHR